MGPIWIHVRTYVRLYGSLFREIRVSDFSGFLPIKCKQVTFSLFDQSCCVYPPNGKNQAFLASMFETAHQIYQGGLPKWGGVEGGWFCQGGRGGSRILNGGDYLYTKDVSALADEGAGRCKPSQWGPEANPLEANDWKAFKSPRMMENANFWSSDLSRIWDLHIFSRPCVRSRYQNLFIGFFYFLAQSCSFINVRK